MEAKKIVAVVGAIDVVLLVVCLVLYMGKDRKGPEILFDEEKQIEYAEGMDEAPLSSCFAPVFAGFNPFCTTAECSPPSSFPP